MNMTGKISPTGQLTGKLSVPKSYIPYDGEYEVTPKAYQDQILETADKLLTRNIVVFEVPYHETHNDSGVTVHIAKEVE